MSSQRFGPERSSRKRQSILQDIYEENLRIERDEPAPRRSEASAETASRSVSRWAMALLSVLILGTVGIAAYWAGGPQRLQERLSQGRLASAEPEPAGGEAEGSLALPEAAARGAAPLADDSLRGRTLPFKSPRSVRDGAFPLHSLPEDRPRALPLGGDSLLVASVFGLEVKTIVIDPGHGGEKDGAIGPSGTKEKHVVLDVARRLKRRLESRYDYRVLMTRTADEHRSLRERVAFANRHRADLFISIHVNSLPVERITSIETYYYGTQASDQVLRLARRENRASGYSVSEFNELLEEVGQTMRRQESRRLATSIQKNLYRNMKNINREVHDWGVKTAPFVVLLGPKVPSVLAEIGVISNQAEEKKLRRATYREKLARFLEEGIAAYLGAAPRARERLAAFPSS